ncbi:MAG TPA: tol-pal system protein YbgF [Rhizomicrobium sp.]
MRLLSRAILPAFAFCLAASGASAAQEPTPQELRARIAAASGQEQALEAQLAQADAKTIRVAALFGESDEEKAARLQHEQNQDQGIANASQRVNDLENSLRSLTGQVEQLDHRIDVLNQRIDRMQKDFDYKLCAVAQQQLGAGEGGLPCDQQTPSATAPNVNPAPQNFTPSTAPATGAPAHLAPGPGTLGTLPAGTALPQNHADQPPMAAATVPPPASNPDYDKAMKLLARTQYDQAAAAFRSFADKNPDSPLAANALFWIGDIAYVQKNYDSAVHLLAEGIKKYPNAAKTPDTFLKLGESLIANNQKKEGCTVFAMLPTKYPNASKVTVAKAASDRKALCK